MTPARKGSFHLLRIAGIDLYLHWMWFVVAVFEIQYRTHNYSSVVWNILEYLSLFIIVTMHEFGHALACRQVGGTANQIVLWPLGGIAFVSPPQRPGATLWSIVAGPLVNVVLVPILGLVFLLAQAGHWQSSMPNAYVLLTSVLTINVGLLIFNLLPVYPLDGGQILRSLLWFFLGRAQSLFVASIMGFIGVAGLLVLAVVMRDLWIGIISVFILLNCWGGLMQARMLGRVARLPRQNGFACPSCHAAPPEGDLWLCFKCRTRFNTFSTLAICPKCGETFAKTQCLDCGAAHPIREWIVPPPLVGE